LQNFNASQFKALMFWLIIGVVLHPIFWLFHGPARVIERDVALKIQQGFLQNIYNKITLLPLKWHQENHSGDIITRINRACAALKRFSEEQFVYVETIIKFILSLGFLFYISPIIGILSLGTCLLAAITIALYDRKLVPLYEQANTAENHIGSGLFDYISNMTTLLTLRLTKLTETNLGQRLLAIWPAYKKEIALNEVKWFIMNMIVTTLQALILLGFILLNIKHHSGILIGTIIMIFRYQWDLSEVFYTLSSHYGEIVQMHTNLKSAEPLLKELKTHTRKMQGEQLAQGWKNLQIRNLTYKHPNLADINLIDGISLKLKPGEKIALIGLSGAGKSTFLNLLSGLYTADKVELNINNTSFHSLAPLHAITTLIPQEPEIFENTILFNITMDLAVSETDIQKLIALATFDKVLKNLPLGLATDMREKGLNLSVGQKQRLALTRGLFAARFSSIVLLDEPTSSVDLPTEKAILSAILEEYQEATISISLHRLHLLPKFSRIIMLENGKIVADGPVAKLLQEDGVVKQLWDKYLEK
jgi:ATP-binding cassette, subfamily B, bacterial